MSQIVFDFQIPFNVVTLETIGDDKATTYFNISTDGMPSGQANVKVRNVLTTDADTFYTVSYTYTIIQYSKSA